MNVRLETKMRVCAKTDIAKSESPEERILRVYKLMSFEGIASGAKREGERADVAGRTEMAEAFPLCWVG